MKKILFVILFLSSLYSINAQNFKFSVKTGFCNSTQAENMNPFAHIRPIEKSIQSAFINAQYSFFLKKNELNIGLQLIEKGYRTEYELIFDKVYEQTTYRNSLNYIELPINYVLIGKKFNFISGIIVSYMYECDYSIKQLGVTYGNPNVVFSTNFSESYKSRNRYMEWDLGLNLGISKELYKNIELELTAQKHFIRIDKYRQKDLIYNTSFLLGIRYSFL